MPLEACTGQGACCTSCIPACFDAVPLPRAQISGRGWKQPGTRAGALKNPHLATSWEKKMANKAEAKLFKEQKTAASDEHKAKLSVRPSCGSRGVMFRASQLRAASLLDPNIVPCQSHRQGQLET